MDISFWQERWTKNEIGFHGQEANPLLVKYWGRLALQKGHRVFVPLCGKTLDIGWFLSQGYKVAGAELVEMAVQQLFAELGIQPQITEAGKLKHYAARNIDIFVGSIFDLPRKMLGPVDAIYDRAALVALPETLRPQYTSQLMEMTDLAPQLLICYEYDQTLQQGPPFSISNEEVHKHYENHYDLSLLGSVNVPGGLKGKSSATENVWLLT